MKGCEVGKASSSGLCELLVELLARAAADHADGDLGALLVARQADHALGQVEDPHRLAHLQHEDLAALGEHRGLEHELDGLLDAHEEPGHAGVGDGDRPTGGDLAGEGGDDAAPAAEHVAEAHHGVRRPGRGVRQDDLLGHALGRAHDADGAHGLVARDEDEALRPGGRGGLDDVLRCRTR